MKLIKTLKILLGIQLLVFSMAMQILYSSSHDGFNDFSALGALLPLGIFGLLGFVNIVLIVVYAARVVSKKLPLDMLIIIFASINIVLVLSYNQLANWALSGPG